MTIAVYKYVCTYLVFREFDPPPLLDQKDRGSFKIKKITLLLCILSRTKSIANQVRYDFVKFGLVSLLQILLRSIGKLLKNLLLRN